MLQYFLNGKKLDLKEKSNMMKRTIELDPTYKKFSKCVLNLSPKRTRLDLGDFYLQLILCRSLNKFTLT